MAQTAVPEGLDGVTGPDARAVWETLDVSRRGAIVDLLLTVVVHPARRGRQSGGGYFDPESVRITERNS